MTPDLPISQILKVSPTLWSPLTSSTSRNALTRLPRLFSTSKRTCQDTEPSLEPSPNLTINQCGHLPDEVLLEIFDSYRQNLKIFGSYLQNIDQCGHQWRKKYAWFNLAHVCRRWRSVVFASSSRLDLNIVVGPKKPGHIKTILSGHLPILIDYLRLDRPEDITDSTLWRMRAALRHRDRVREISLRGWDVIFGKFIRAINHYFPALESLVLSFPYGNEPDIPATFLRGPDQSYLPLRRLRLNGAPLASVSELLLSATALTDLTLTIANTAVSIRHKDRSFLPVCKACNAYAVSI
jgi:hypothetical protein